MRFAVLGTLVVTDEGRSLPLRGAVERRLLAALLANANHFVLDEVLAEWVWGDLDDGWKNRLQTSISRLNRTLGGSNRPPRIVREGASYRLVVNTNELDVLVFEQLRWVAVEALARGDPGKAAAAAEAALAEWRGRAFGELADERFAHDRARTLQAHRRETQQVRIEALLQLGQRVEEVIPELEALVAGEPGNERWRALLAKALYRSGRPGDALEVCRSYRKELVEGTGRDPGSELARLEQAILDNDPALDEIFAVGGPGGAVDRPAGPRSFLFTGLDDGSGGSGGPGGAEREGDAVPGAQLHEVEVRGAISARGGRVFSLPGNDPCAVFDRPLDALLAARDAAVVAHRSAAELGRRVRVRMALHTGEAEPRGQSFAGATITRVARMRDAGHPGQVLVSAATRELVIDHLPPDVGLLDIGAWQFDGSRHPERLYQLTHDALARQFPPLRTGRRHTGRLPRYTTAFVGREREVTHTAGRLEDHPLVTITGDGGIGKTRLALEVAHRATDADYPDGVWYCDVSLADDTDTLVERVSARCGRVPRSDNGTRHDLVRALEAARLLLVLDGCERLSGPVAELVGEVLAAGSRARFLVTSRSPLHVPAEQVIKLRPLPVPGPDDPEPEAAPAVQLLCELAVRAGARVVPSDVHVVELARRLEGLPLAMELAAPLLASIGAPTLVERLDHGFEPLTGSPGAPARHRTLRATFDWSFDLISPEARSLLAALSLFRGTWSLDTAEAVATAVDVDPDRVMGLVAELVDHSLLRVDMPAGGTARYTMLDTIRAYAAEHLAGAGRYDAVADLHADHFLDLAERALPHRRGPDEAAWVGKLLAELDNLRAAYRHLVDRGRFPEALRLVVALGDELLMREKLEIERWATELAALPALAGEPLRAAALGLAANASLLRGRLDEAHTRALAAIEAEALTGAPPSWMPRNALAILTVLRVVEGDWQDHLDAMEAIGDATGDPFPRAMTLWNRAFVDVLVGEPDRAEPSAVQLRALGERHDNPSMRAMGLLWLGRVAALRHDVDRARDLLHQALGAAEAAQTTLVVNRTMRALADLASGTGDHTAGLAALRRVARSFAASGNVAEQLQTVMSMAEQFVALGDLTSAATALGALSRTPMAATAGYKAIAGIVAERLDPAERLAARRRGSSLEPEALMDQLVRAIDDLAGQAAEQGEDQR